MFFLYNNIYKYIIFIFLFLFFMKKIISYLIIISIFLLPFFIKNTTFGYEISNEKEKIISKYFNKDIENTILNIV